MTTNRAMIRRLSTLLSLVVLACTEPQSSGEPDTTANFDVGCACRDHAIRRRSRRHGGLAGSQRSRQESDRRHRQERRHLAVRTRREPAPGSPRWCDEQRRSANRGSRSASHGHGYLDRDQQSHRRHDRFSTRSTQALDSWFGSPDFPATSASLTACACIGRRSTTPCTCCSTTSSVRSRSISSCPAPRHR